MYHKFARTRLVSALRRGLFTRRAARRTLSAALLLLPACHASTDESTGVAQCDRYVETYRKCLGKTGLDNSHMVPRISMLRRSFENAADAAADEGARAALEKKCMEATRRLEESCR